MMTALGAVARETAVFHDGLYPIVGKGLGERGEIVMAEVLADYKDHAGLMASKESLTTDESERQRHEKPIAV